MNTTGVVQHNSCICCSACGRVCEEHHDLQARLSAAERLYSESRGTMLEWQERLKRAEEVVEAARGAKRNPSSHHHAAALTEAIRRWEDVR